jgi:hypothetical protein
MGALNTQAAISKPVKPAAGRKKAAETAMTTKARIAAIQRDLGEQKRQLKKSIEEREARGEEVRLNFFQKQLLDKWD